MINLLTKRKASSILLLYLVGYTFLLPISIVLISNTDNLYGNPIFIGGHVVVLCAICYLSREVLAKDWVVFRERIGFNLKQVLLHYLGNYGFMIVANIIIMSIVEVGSANQNAVIELTETNQVFGILLAVFFAPIVEELVFRTSILSLFYKKNKTLAIILSACAFGMIHVFSSLFTQNWTDLLYFITYSGMGYFITRCYVKCENVYAAMLFHFINNAVAMIVMIFI